MLLRRRDNGQLWLEISAVLAVFAPVGLASRIAVAASVSAVVDLEGQA